VGAVRQPGTRPFGLERLRSAVPLGWAGLLVWLWATAALPALHAVQHAREAAAQAGQAPNRQRIQALIDEVLGQVREPGPRRHSHQHGPGQAPHGKGSLEHLDAAFAAVATFVPPSAFEVLGPAPLIAAPPQPVLLSPWRPHPPRGPPPLPSADRRS
jgi:hypothetical protein